jgi:hypothetical protein
MTKESIGCLLPCHSEEPTGLHCLRPGRTCNQNWSKTALAGVLNQFWLNFRKKSPEPITHCRIKGALQPIYIFGDFFRNFNRNWSKTAYSSWTSRDWIFFLAEGNVSPLGSLECCVLCSLAIHFLFSSSPLFCSFTAYLLPLRFSFLFSSHHLIYLLHNGLQRE